MVSEWALMRDVQGHMAQHKAFTDETTHSPFLLSVRDDQAAHLFLAGPGDEQVDTVHEDEDIRP